MSVGNLRTVRPADYVISQFKGVRATARALGRHPSTVSRWQRTKDERGTDGQIPRQVMSKILAKARELKLDITVQDLLLGREVCE
jgi:transposase